MTTGVVNTLAEKWFPLPVEKFFTMQRAPDMWFADELPPTLQDEMRNPLLLQSKAMIAYQVSAQLARGEQQRIMAEVATRRQHATARVGKRVKSTRH